MRAALCDQHPQVVEEVLHRAVAAFEDRGRRAGGETESFAPGLRPDRMATHGSIGHDDQLSGRSIVLHVLMRLDDFVETEDAVEVERKAAGFYVSDDALQSASGIS